MSCSFPVQPADSVMTVSGPGTEHVAEDGELIWSYFLHNSDYIIGRCDLLLKKKKRSELFLGQSVWWLFPRVSIHRKIKVCWTKHILLPGFHILLMWFLLLQLITQTTAHFLLDFSAIVFDDDLRSDAFTWDYFTVRVHFFILYSLFSFSSLLRTHFCWLLGHFCGDFTSLLCRNYAQ